MTKPKLLANLPIANLTKENDYLGVLEKGNLISTFLKGNKERFEEIKMFSLYGEWGSGKSTLMKYLEKDLNNEFNTFFFEAWQFEKDENLALSLLEFMNAKNIDKYFSQIDYKSLINDTSFRKNILFLHQNTDDAD